MALFNKLKQKAFAEFIDIIEWTDDTSNSMIWRLPRFKSEINNGAQLTLHEEIAGLINKGQFTMCINQGLTNSQSLTVCHRYRNFLARFRPRCKATHLLYELYNLKTH